MDLWIDQTPFNYMSLQLGNDEVWMWLYIDLSHNFRTRIALSDAFK